VVVLLSISLFFLFLGCFHGIQIHRPQLVSPRSCGGGRRLGAASLQPCSRTEGIRTRTRQERVGKVFNVWCVLWYSLNLWGYL